MPAGGELKQVWLPLDRIVPRPNIPAGLNPLRVMAIADTLRNGNGHTPPIEVRRLGKRRYLLLEGRHRWAAHWVAGCCVIRAKVKA